MIKTTEEGTGLYSQDDQISKIIKKLDSAKN